MTVKPTVDWEFFITNLDPASAPPPIPLRLRQYTTARTCRALWTYRTRGWIPAHRYLRQLRGGPGSATNTELPTATAVRLARQQVFPCQLLVRALIPNALCLPRSFALATYLAAIGLPAEVTIARALIAPPQDSFHSWTELYGVVLNDTPDVQLGYKVLQRVSASLPGENT
jgi:hypothetical protein